MFNKIFTSMLIALVLSGSIYAQSLNTRNLTTDKASYNPGSTVNFDAYIDSYTSGLSLTIEYWDVAQQIGTTQTVTANSANVSWSWTTPNTDYRGYTVLVKLMQGTTEKSRISTGVDVSSSWSKFPRYIFSIIYLYLTSCHISSLQATGA